MKLFFDTEFTGLHQNTTLISLGIIAENGHTFYAEFMDYDKNQIDNWIRENILSKLLGGSEKDRKDDEECVIIGYKEIIKFDLSCWLKQFDKIEMWGDCLSYDWILFCELFGGVLQIPRNIYYIPFDICTLFMIKGIDPDINRENFAENIETKDKHNALYDAQIIKACYNKLIKN